MSKIVKYIHHGKKVSVDVLLRGKADYYNLCQECKFFIPNEPNVNCDIAEMLYRICRLHNIITPVFECHKFKSK